MGPPVRITGLPDSRTRAEARAVSPECPTIEARSDEYVTLTTTRT